MTLTTDEVAMFYALYTCAERVDWTCYESFRVRILTEGAKPTPAHFAADTLLPSDQSPLASESARVVVRRSSAASASSAP